MGERNSTVETCIVTGKRVWLWSPHCASRLIVNKAVIIDDNLTATDDEGTIAGQVGVIAGARLLHLPG